MLVKKDVEETVTRMRTGLEIGAVVAGVIFAIGVIFSSGIQYSRLTDVRTVQITHGAAISMLQSQLMPINEQLAREDALLQDIRSELRMQTQRENARRARRHTHLTQ